MEIPDNTIIRCYQCGGDFEIKDTMPIPDIKGRVGARECTNCFWERASNGGMRMRHRKLLFNGNEIVFEDEPNSGVAGIASGLPDEFAKMLVQRWNDAEPCEGCTNSPNDCPGVSKCAL